MHLIHATNSVFIAMFSEVAVLRLKTVRWKEGKLFIEILFLFLSVFLIFKHIASWHYLNLPYVIQWAG